jgi:hypothetical protein
VDELDAPSDPVRIIAEGAPWLDSGLLFGAYTPFFERLEDWCALRRAALSSRRTAMSVIVCKCCARGGSKRTVANEWVTRSKLDAAASQAQSGAQR